MELRDKKFIKLKLKRDGETDFVNNNCFLETIFIAFFFFLAKMNTKKLLKYIFRV